jgi:NAD(P)H-hydrate epimerase
MTGAPVLAAAAAYRAGAGLVILASPASALAVAQRALVEAVFVPLPETDAGTVAAGAVDVVAERFGAIHALAIGPGLTTHPETADAVRRIVNASTVPVVLDADGLNAFSMHGAGSVELRELADRRAELVATPHAGEFARLTGVPSGDLATDRMGHARKAAADLRATVLLKGPRTIVAEPSGVVRVNPTGGPALATGGTGDVLTGAIAALVARGLEPADAAVLGAFVHGLAGSAAGTDLGDGATATDVLARLPATMANLRSGLAEPPDTVATVPGDDGKDA